MQAVFPTIVTGNMEEYVPDAAAFWPARWLKPHQGGFDGILHPVMVHACASEDVLPIWKCKFNYRNYYEIQWWATTIYSHIYVYAGGSAAFVNVQNYIAYCRFSAVCCGVRGRALALHTGVRRFDSRGGNSLLLFSDYKLRSIYKSWKSQWVGSNFN